MYYRNQNRFVTGLRDLAESLTQNLTVALGAALGSATLALVPGTAITLCGLPGGHPVSFYDAYVGSLEVLLAVRLITLTVKR